MLMATRKPESRTATATGTATAPAMAVVRDPLARRPLSAMASVALRVRCGRGLIDVIACALRYAAAESNPTTATTTAALVTVACQGCETPGFGGQRRGDDARRNP